MPGRRLDVHERHATSGHLHPLRSGGGSRRIRAARRALGFGPSPRHRRTAQMPKTVILSAARTPIGKLGGGLAGVDATELGGTAIKAALERAEVGPEQVQHVVMGQVIQAGQGQIPSRQAQVKAGIPKDVSSETINKVCAWGIRADGMLAAAIRAGSIERAVGGGMGTMCKLLY